MKFLKYEFDAEAGDILEVSIIADPRGANVVLLDAENLTKYMNNSPSFEYAGGYFDTKDSVRLTVPRTGHWYLAVDLGGRSGRVSAWANLRKHKEQAAGAV